MLNLFAVGSQRIRSENYKAEGRVISIQNCRWMKVNKKPIRAHALDGAEFPHVIRFVYRVNGVEYKGSKWIDHCSRCPRENEEIAVYYDKNKPQKYAVDF